MDMFDIIIDGEIYSYINSIIYEGIHYIAYTNGEITTIGKCIIDKNKNIEIHAIDDKTFNKVKEFVLLW